MKISLLYTSILLLIVQQGYSQKEIKAVPISEGSKLSIEAKAETVNNVTFTITSTISLEGFDVKEKFPYKIKIAPFNQKTFKDNLLEFFYMAEKYQTENEKLSKLLDTINDTTIEPEFDNETINALKNVFSDEKKLKVFGDKSATLEDIKKSVGEIDEARKDLLKTALEQTLKDKKIDLLDNQLNESINLSRTKKYDDDSYEKKIQLDDRINTLYRYFNDQIVLLFEYDTEPVAGTLFYNSKIEGVQYFTNRSYETYFQNKKRDYHRLIKKLYRFARYKLKDSLLIDTLTLDDYKKELDLSMLKKESRDYVSQQVDRTTEIIKGMESEYDYFQSAIRHLSNVQKKRPFYKLIGRTEAENIMRIEFWDFDEIETKDDSLKLINYLDNNFSNDKIEALRESFEMEILNEKIVNGFKKKKEGRSKEFYREIILNHFERSSNRDTFYIHFPDLFMYDFRELVNSFRIYNRNKRNQLIYKSILEKKNKQIYDSLCILSSEYDSIFSTLTKTNAILKFQKALAKSLGEARKYDNYKGAKKQKEYLDLTIKNLNLQSEVEKMNYKEKVEFLRKNGITLERLSYTYMKIISGETNLDKRITDRWNSFYESYLDFMNLVKSDNTLLGLYDLENEDLNEDSAQGSFDLFFENLRQYRFYSNEITQDQLFKSSCVNSDSTILKNSFRKSLNVDRLILESLEKEKKCLEAGLTIITSNIEVLLKKAPLWNFEPELIELDFNDGFVEHTVMYGKVTGMTSNDDQLDYCDETLLNIMDSNKKWKNNINRNIKFVNQFPYGFSSSRDYDDFKQYNLAVYNGQHREFEVQLSKIFSNYIQKLANNRLDFSPKNGVVTLRKEDMKSDKNNSIELKKETSSKLFNFSVYTDFVGFQDNPNGLVQVEFSKLIPLYTKRKTNEFWRRYLGQGYNFGRFNYILPQFRWSRLDSGDEKENLPLSYQSVFEGGIESQVPFVTTLNLLRFENISVGADLNLVSFDFPTSKFRFELNAGARYGRTKVLDTAGEPIQITEDSTNVRTTFDVNTWRYYPEFIFRLRPEERYGANLSWRPIRFNTVTTDFSTVSSEEQFRRDLTDNPQWLHQMEINAHYSPTGRRENRFFFRYRYTNNANWETNGFSEIHLGYSLSLRVNNKE